MESALLPLLHKAAAGQHLSFDEAARAFQIVMGGGATPAQIASLLTALAMNGESADEIAGAAQALTVKATPFTPLTPRPALLDTCGTGGDGKNTLNISTAVALVAAACGIDVVKHGNRAVSSSSGSADVLEQLGVKIDVEPEKMQRALEQTHFAFLFAPRYHKAMRHVAPIRQELKIRTLFNVLGPLVNPAKPTHQLLGVYAPHLLMPMAQALRRMGLARAWVVHGEDGVDEISISAPTQVVELHHDEFTQFTVTPEDAGLPYHPPEALKGDDAASNAKRLHGLLQGERGAYHDAVALNVAACLILTGKVGTLATGAAMASEAMAEGKAFNVLQKLIYTA